MVIFTGACPISNREGEAKFWITLYLPRCRIVSEDLPRCTNLTTPNSTTLAPRWRSLKSTLTVKVKERQLLNEITENFKLYLLEARYRRWCFGRFSANHRPGEMLFRRCCGVGDRVGQCKRHGKVSESFGSKRPDPELSDKGTFIVEASLWKSLWDIGNVVRLRQKSLWKMRNPLVR